MLVTRIVTMPSQYDDLEIFVRENDSGSSATTIIFVIVDVVLIIIILAVIHFKYFNLSMLVDRLLGKAEKKSLQTAPKFLASSIESFDASLHTEPCRICEKAFQPKEKVRILHCNHAFHSRCIDPCLTLCVRVCPTCRTVINVPEDKAKDFPLEIEYPAHSTPKASFISTASSTSTTSTDYSTDTENYARLCKNFHLLTERIAAQAKRQIQSSSSSLEKQPRKSYRKKGNLGPTLSTPISSTQSLPNTSTQSLPVEKSKSNKSGKSRGSQTV